MKHREGSGRLLFIVSMLIFSTVGVLRRYIPLPSGFIAMVRGLVGALTLLLVLCLSGKRPDWTALVKKLPILIITGALIGGNWILLFESYNYTSVAVAVLCYYMAPTFVILASPFLFGEKLNLTGVVTLVLSLVGMVLVSGALESGFTLSGDALIGVLLALGAAVLYASVILCNKKITGIDSGMLTVVELASAGIVVLPYTLLCEKISPQNFTPLGTVLLLILGIVHTGLAYAMYFGSLGKLSARTVAVLGYIDPIVAVVLSALLLKEPLTPLTVLGAVLILGATLFAELHKSRDKGKTPPDHERESPSHTDESSPD